MAASHIRAIAPWFGSKRSLAPKIVELLGDHTAYWEPFCGSLSVLLAKRPSQQETVSDLHGHLINLARVLASEEAVDLYERASRILPCHELYEEIAQSPEPADAVDQALRFLVLSWMGRNGIAGTRRATHQPSLRFTPGGGSSSTRWRSAVESIPWWHERLRNVLIVRRDAFELLGKIADDRRVAIYVDPPYFCHTRGGSEKYLHDFGAEDHQRLATCLARFRHARVVVSYYDAPEVRSLYSGWTILDASRQKNLHCQNRRGAAKALAPEILITNRSDLRA